ncbi:unnamed protein product [Protopolystoma xenopodis]|uniref:Uncharacterized protein n=1 Tax=Protopolystoma xenopodis TaxID=117903 RepID=A0A3S5BN79_9PLAT|nr:unnamed protein product [Protopolystoma xenopodis]
MIPCISFHKQVIINSPSNQLEVSYSAHPRQTAQEMLDNWRSGTTTPNGPRSPCVYLVLPDHLQFHHRTKMQDFSKPVNRPISLKSQSFAPDSNSYISLAERATESYALEKLKAVRLITVMLAYARPWWRHRIPNISEGGDLPDSDLPVSPVCFGLLPETREERGFCHMMQEVTTQQGSDIPVIQTQIFGIPLESWWPIGVPAANADADHSRIKTLVAKVHDRLVSAIFSPPKCPSSTTTCSHAIDPPLLYLISFLERGSPQAIFSENMTFKADSYPVCPLQNGISSEGNDSEAEPDWRLELAKETGADFSHDHVYTSSSLTASLKTTLLLARQASFLLSKLPMARHRMNAYNRLTEAEKQLVRLANLDLSDDEEDDDGSEEEEEDELEDETEDDVNDEDEVDKEHRVDGEEASEASSVCSSTDSMEHTLKQVGDATSSLSSISGALSSLPKRPRSTLWKKGSFSDRSEAARLGDRKHGQLRNSGLSSIRLSPPKTRRSLLLRSGKSAGSVNLRRLRR